MTDQLPNWIKIGAKFRVPRVAALAGGGTEYRTFHVRGIVDGCAVLREWSRSKRYWKYTVEDPIFFDVMKDRIIR